MLRRFAFGVVLFAIIASCGRGEGSGSERTSAVVETQTGFADVPGGRLYYEVAGTGDAIVLIHGNAGDRRHWDSQFEALANGHRVIRYDVRGFGRSSVPVEGEAYWDYEDLAALLDHLGIGSAHIGGWSMGSGIAVDFVLAYPEKAKSLISVGPWVNGYLSPAAQEIYDDFGQVGAALVEGGAPAAVDAWMMAPFFATTIRDSAAGAEFRRIATDYSWWALSHPSPLRFLEPSAVGRIAEVKVPTLILTAEHDVPACLEIADLLDESAPDSRKVVMAETGHLMHMEKPDEFNQYLVDFVRSVGGG